MVVGSGWVGLLGVMVNAHHFPSLETRNLSLGCLRFFRLALLPVLDPLYLALVQDKKITCVLPANACCTVYVNFPHPMIDMKGK